MMQSKKLNGGAALLANAVQTMLDETRTAFSKDLDQRDKKLSASLSKSLSKDMNRRDKKLSSDFSKGLKRTTETLDRKIDSVNQVTCANVQAQIAELHKTLHQRKPKTAQH